MQLSKRAAGVLRFILGLSALSLWTVSEPLGKPLVAAAKPISTVTSLADDGSVGTLRQVITAAASGDTITFDPGVTGTITLTMGELLINTDLTIQGPGASSLIISGNRESRVFEIASRASASLHTPSVSITDLTISKGRSNIGAGILNGGTLTITNSTITDNGRIGFVLGGGICNESGTLTIIRSTISQNGASLGGGILNVFGSVTIVNSTISGNITTSGAGIMNIGTISTMTISNSTISQIVGLIVSNDGTSNIKNSILANNFGANCSNSGTLNTSGVNFSTDSSCPGFIQVTSDQLNLGPLQVNTPGTTATHALLAGSVAIDSVSDCTDVAGNPVTTDQRGATRPIDGDGNGSALCDAGSYEARACSNDSLPPQITCPANVTAKTAVACPPPTSAMVTFAAPVVSDNCPGVTPVCTPPSGSTFGLGATTVTCSATNPGGNSATCVFTVNVFNGSLQDDSNPNSSLLFNTMTGAYIFCCNGMIFTGTGTVNLRGCTFTLQHNAQDRRLIVSADYAVKKGTASLQLPPGTSKCTITDRDMTNNARLCP